MHQHDQESIFIEEVEKLINRMTKELDLSYPFVIGALELIIHDIKQDYFKDD